MPSFPQLGDLHSKENPRTGAGFSEKGTVSDSRNQCIGWPCIGIV